MPALNTQTENMNTQDREFEFNQSDFDFLADLVFEKTGIHLAPHKKNMVYSRIARRIRKLELNNFAEYCNFITSEKGGTEIMDFINAVTTNLTHFFRENHHFEHLTKTAIPEILEKNSKNKRLRIWSAGCSSGMEPYSIAMTLRSAFRDVDSWDAKILATDIDTNMLERGASGIYPSEEYDNIPERFKNEFVKLNQQKDEMVMSDKLKKLIHFKRLNFIEPWPVRGPFDIIFCRNVVIYFKKETQKIIFNQFANVLKTGQYLYIGHSENLHGVSDRFQLIGKTIYKKIK